MRHFWKTAIGAAFAMAVAGNAQAQVNVGPPGQAYDTVLDLSGSTVGTGYTQYGAGNTITFVATGTTSTVTFAFRNDPGYFAFDNASVMDITNPSGNLLVNGDFEAPRMRRAGGIGRSPRSRRPIRVLAFILLLALFRAFRALRALAEPGSFGATRLGMLTTRFRSPSRQRRAIPMPSASGSITTSAAPIRRWIRPRRPWTLWFTRPMPSRSLRVWPFWALDCWASVWRAVAGFNRVTAICRKILHSIGAALSGAALFVSGLFHQLRQNSIQMIVGHLP